MSKKSSTFARFYDNITTICPIYLCDADRLRSLVGGSGNVPADQYIRYGS